jgi:PHS family inorganic phosphate transporter-like MFS transporter
LSGVRLLVLVWIFFLVGFLGWCADGGFLGFTLLLPEVAGRDPDVILEQEMKEQQQHR